MFRFIILLSMFFASAVAFSPAGRLQTNIARSNSLVMGTLLETFKFKKIMNRFTFKTLAEAIEAAGLQLQFTITITIIITITTTITTIRFS